MKFNLNKILSEWAYRVDDGQPNVSNADHINHLREVLYNFGLPHEFIVEYVHGLTETQQYVDNSQNRKLNRVGKEWGSAGKVPTSPSTDDTVTVDPPIDNTDTPGKEANTDVPGTEVTTDRSADVKSPKNIKKSVEISKELKEDLEFILTHRDTTRLKSGAGSNSPSHEDVAHLQTFTSKRMEQDKQRLAGIPIEQPDPYVHKDVNVRKVDDVTLDKSIEYLKDSLPEKEFNALIKKFAKGGAVPAHLTALRKLKKGEEGYPGYDPTSKGYVRAREIIRLYLINDGKSPVTGKLLPLSHMEPDHRVPFTTAESDIVNSKQFDGLSIKAKKPSDGNSIQEIMKKKKGELTDYDTEVLSVLHPLQAKYDDPTTNMDLMSGPVNQFKGSAINDKLLNSIRRKLAENPEETRLENEYNSERKKLLNKYHREALERGDTSAMSEKVIMEADDVERNEIMKAHNYWHPNAKELNLYTDGKEQDGIEPDTEYYSKLKAHWAEKGVDLPENPDDIDFDTHPFDKWMTRLFSSGRSRGGAKRQSGEDEIPYMIEHFKKSGYEVPSLKDNKKQNDIVNEVKQRVIRAIDKKRIAWLALQLKNPDLSSRKRKNREEELAKLEKLQG